MPVSMVPRKNSKGKQEKENRDDQAAGCGDGEESTDGTMLISLSGRADSNRCDQWSTLGAVHLFIKESTHDDG